MYHTLTHNYYRKCDGVIIVFDVSNKDTFEKIHYWVKAVHDNTDSSKKIKQVIIGNKIDLENERQVTKEEGEKMACSYSLKYFETSAKKDIGINEFMQSIIKDIIQEKEKGNEEEINENIKLEKKIDEEKKGYCCY